MSRYFCRLLTLLIIAGAGVFADNSQVPQAPTTEFSSDLNASLVIDGCVDVASLSTVLREELISTGGTEPIVLTRSNGGNNYNRGSLGDGFGLDIPWRIFKLRKEGNKWHAIWTPREGARERLTGTREDTAIVLRPLKASFAHGRNNLGSGMSGQTDGGNMEFRYLDWQERHRSGRFEVSLGDGTKRYYSPYGKPKEKQFLLEKERLPSGNWRYYHFDAKQRIERIETKGADDTLINFVEVAYKIDKVLLKSSDGKSTTVHLRREKLHGRIDDLSDDHAIYSDDEISYAERIEGEHMPSKTYSVGGGEWISEQKKFHSIRLAGETERVFQYRDEGRSVSALKVPGANGKLRTKWSFKEPKDKRGGDIRRRIENPYGGASYYHYGKDSLLLKAIHHPETIERYYWDRSQKRKPARLTRWELRDLKHQIIKRLEFDYDESGNIIKETLSGCLCQAGSWDSDTREYTYSDDGFNLMLSVTASNGLTSQFRYKPGTKLLVSSWQEQDGQILSRSFYHYDDYANLTTKIEDDGSSEEEEELSNVSWRRITRCSPSTELPSFGLPLESSENYLDIESGEERQLSRKVYHYDERGLCGQVDSYDADERLLGSETWYYNKQRLCESYTNALGVVAEYSYDERRNRVTEHCFETDVWQHYKYDAQNQLTETRAVYPDADEKIERTVWHLGGQPEKQIDRYGSVTEQSFDQAGRVTRSSGPLGSTSYAYDPMGRPSLQIDPEGYRTETDYNLRGQPLEIRHPDGSSESFRYDQRALCIEHVERDGSRVSYSYDAQGNCLRKQRSKGKFKETIDRRYKSSRLLSETAQGLSTYYQHDGAGRLIESRAASRRTTYHYDGQGQVAETRRWLDDDSYIAEQVDYDAYGRPIEERSQHSDGTLLSYAARDYDKMGQLIAERRYSDEANAAETQYVYNSAGELVAVIDPLGNSTDYDLRHDKGRSEQSVDPHGRRTLQTFDALGRLSTKTLYSATGKTLSASRYHYGGRGLKTREEHDVYSKRGFERCYVVSYEYDALGQCTAIHEPGRSNRFDYDLAGRLSSTTKPDGVVLFHDYDDAGDQISLRSSDGSIQHVFEYDKRHNCIKGTDLNSGHEVLRRYNIFSELTHESLDGLEQSYRHNLLGQRIRFKLPLELGSVSYERQSGRLASITRSGTQSYSHDYQNYDLLGHPTEQQLIGVAGKLQHDYDELGRVRSIDSKPWQLHVPDGGYNQLGLLEEQHVRDLHGTYIFKAGYDSWDQLANESGAFQHSYEHDSLEQRLAVDETPYHSGEHMQLEAVGPATLDSDANGNPLRNGATEYRYDALGRLAQLQSPTLRVSYAYDVFGRRIRKTVEERETIGWIKTGQESYLWDGDREIGSLDAHGELRTLRILGLGYGLEVGASIAIEIDGSVYAPIHDSSGNISCLVDAASAAPAASYRYSAFGECLSLDEEGPRNPWRFSSKRHDDEAGLVYFGQRYYQPHYGRWLTSDPIGLQDGLNTYCYAHNKPVTLIDPTGLWSLSAFCEGLEQPEEMPYSGVSSAWRTDPGSVDTNPAWAEWRPNLTHAESMSCSYPLSTTPASTPLMQSVRCLVAPCTSSAVDMKASWPVKGCAIACDTALLYSGVRAAYLAAKGAFAARMVASATEVRVAAVARSALAEAPSTSNACGKSLFVVDRPCSSVVKPTIYPQLQGVSRIQNPRVSSVAREALFPNPLDGTRYTDKVLMQMRPNPRTGLPDHHGFPREVDGYARYGSQGTIVGRDGVSRTKISLPGAYKGSEGQFEWIIESNGFVNHRFFKVD